VGEWLGKWVGGSAYNFWTRFDESQCASGHGGHDRLGDIYSAGLQTEFTGMAQRSAAVRVFYLGILQRLARRLGPGCLSG